MSDPFAQHSDSPTAPARRVMAVVPHDQQTLPRTPKALYVGDTGDVVLRAVDDDADVRFANVPAGTILPVRISHVRLTGTTASALVAFC